MRTNDASDTVLHKFQRSVNPHSRALSYSILASFVTSFTNLHCRYQEPNSLPMKDKSWTATVSSNLSRVMRSVCCQFMQDLQVMSFAVLSL